MNNRREICREFAEMAMCLYGDDDTITYGEAYHKYVEEKQAEYDRESAASGSQRIDLQKIRYRFVADWKKRLSKAAWLSDAAYERRHEEYIQAFFDEYYESVFSSRDQL